MNSGKGHHPGVWLDKQSLWWLGILGTVPWLLWQIHGSRTLYYITYSAWPRPWVQWRLQCNFQLEWLYCYHPQVTSTRNWVSCDARWVCTSTRSWNPCDQCWVRAHSGPSLTRTYKDYSQGSDPRAWILNLFHNTIPRVDKSFDEPIWLQSTKDSWLLCNEGPNKAGQVNSTSILPMGVSTRRSEPRLWNLSWTKGSHGPWTSIVVAPLTANMLS